MGPGGTTTVDPTRVLAEQADRVRALVESVVVLHPGRRTLTVGDGQDACDLSGGNRWPLRWSHARRTYYDDVDPLETAREIAAGFVGQGWLRRTDAAGPGQVRIVVQRDGTAVGIDADVAEEGRTLQISAGSPCVTADGSLERRYLP